MTSTVIYLFRMKLSEAWKSQEREKRLVRDSYQKPEPYTRADLAIDIVIGLVIFTAIAWLWVKV